MRFFIEYLNSRETRKEKKFSNREKVCELSVRLTFDSADDCRLQSRKICQATLRMRTNKNSMTEKIRVAPLVKFLLHIDFACVGIRVCTWACWY